MVQFREALKRELKKPEGMQTLPNTYRAGKPETANSAATGKSTKTGPRSPLLFVSDHSSCYGWISQQETIPS